MKKIDGKTMDVVAENVGKLKKLFPDAFTEDGTTKSTKIDWDVLRELLGEYVSDKDERYSFTWNGKSKARMIAQTPSTGTLRPCKEESVDWDTTQNIFIEGDNLEVLKLLQKSYHKKVKMIYIDPPYNTGNDFVYKDNFKDNIKNYKEITGQVDGEGRNLSNNPETSGRYHTDWLNMMYPRLKLARNLLKDDGVIFISIDDNEVSNLRKMCDEIYGEENFLTGFMWKRKKETSNDSRNVAIQGEYILSYTKSDAANLKNEPLSEEYIESSYKEPNEEFPLGKWRPVPITVSKGLSGGGYEYVITTPTGNTHNRIWAYPENSFNELKAKGLVYWGVDKSGVPQRVMYAHDSKGQPTTNYWDKTSSNKEGKKVILDIFGDNYFDTTKPLKLINRLSSLVLDNEDIVLDFFAGSSTTAHAIMEMNLDGKQIKYIMLQLPEACDKKSAAFKAGYKTIAEISKERIRRAAAKIKEELSADDADETDLFNPEKNNLRESAKSADKLDLGFKVFKLDSTNIKPWEVDFDLTERTLEDFISNIKTDRREEDLLYEILLKYGLDLTLPITEHNIAGQKVFDIGMGALIVCLSDAISLEVVEGIAKQKDKLNPEIMRVVFKDSGFKDDVVKTNAVQILKQAGIVDVRSL